MRTQLIIQLAKDVETNARWLRIEPGQGATPVATGSLADLATQTAGAQIVVLVPGTDINLTQISVPTTNKQRMLKAIPFALEDQVAQNVEDVHFALGTRDADGKISTAIVSRERMDAWTAKLADAGIYPHAIVPDVLVLPNEENSWSLLTDGDLLYVSHERNKCYCLDLENAPFMLTLLLDESGKDEQRSLIFYGDEAQGEHLNPHAENISFEIRALNGGLLELLEQQKKGIELDKSINLLQGDYSRREQIGKLWRPWRFAASLAGVWFVLQMTISIYDVSVLEGKKEALQKEVEQVYRSAFPQAKKIVNAKVQMQRELDKLRGGSGGDKVGFLNLLADSGNAFRQTGGLVLKSVRYKNNSLDVELEVSNLQLLDQLKQKLTNESQLAVEIQSAAAKDNKVQGRLNIKRNS